MGFYSGRDGELYVAGTKAAKVQSWSFSSSMAVLETTSLGDTDRTLESGVRSYSGSARLFYYVETPGSGANSNLNTLLTSAIKNSFSSNPGRVWVHTCSLDHRNALNNYISRGMKIFKKETITI